MKFSAPGSHLALNYVDALHLRNDFVSLLLPIKDEARTVCIVAQIYAALGLPIWQERPTKVRANI